MFLNDDNSAKSSISTTEHCHVHQFNQKRNTLLIGVNLMLLCNQSYELFYGFVFAWNITSVKTD
jgi:hypothetical protein